MVTINGKPGVSLGYKFGVQRANSDKVFEFPSYLEAEKIANSIPGAKVVMCEVYATLWIDTL